MLQFLFHRNSRFPRCLEGVGTLLALITLYQSFHPLMLLIVLLCLFICGCDWYPWYPPADRGLGIQVHFRKARIPAAYILVITTWAYLSGLTYPVMVPALVGLLVVTTVNGILIYFHWQDKDPLPINYFSANKYLGLTQK